jgi:ATP synthase I chain
MEMVGVAQYELTERRIAWLTLILGGIAAVGGWVLYSQKIGAGVGIGAVLAWINFRWLERAMNAVTRASTAQAGSPEARVPVLSYASLFGRYALIAAVVYVIFSRFRIPVLSMLVGLCALGAAAIMGTVWEVVSPDGREEDRGSD